MFCFIQGGIGKTWLLAKDEQNLIPEGLRERDFKLFPRTEFKKIGPKFGTNAGKIASKRELLLLCDVINASGAEL